MKYYAYLNQDRICQRIISSPNAILNEDLIELQDYNDDKIYRKYENGVWSSNKYTPTLDPKIQDALDHINLVEKKLLEKDIKIQDLENELIVMSNALNEFILGGIK